MQRLYLRGDTWFCKYYLPSGRRVRTSTRCRGRDAAEAVAARLEREAHGVPDPDEQRWFRGRFDSFVYFIQDGEDGPIKIGRTGQAGVRLARMQTATPRKLRLLCTFPGASVMERSLHRAFASSHIQGEWFKPTLQLLSLIRELSGLWDRAEAAGAAEDEVG